MAGEPQRVGFVGIGNQGAPIAMRILQGGHSLTVWARRPEAMAEFEAAGAQSAGSVAELGASCPMVAVCVTTDDDVLEVTTGEGGLLAAMAPGSTLCVHSTAHPDTVRAVHAAGAARGVTVIDAPVSGGNLSAVAGTMSILVGGDAAAVDRWRPVFATYATSVEVLGGVGAGQLAKLVNNALSAVTLAASLWALDSAEALGLDREAMFRVLTASSGDSFMLRRAPGTLEGGAKIAAPRLRKDLLLYQEVLASDDTDGESLAAAADTAVQTLERIAAKH